MCLLKECLFFADPSNGKGLACGEVFDRMRGMRPSSVGFALLLGACASGQVVPPPLVSEPIVARERPEVREEVIHEVELEGIRIRFWGSRVPDGVRESFGVTGMDVVFGEDKAVRYQPKGSLYFSDWRFDIVSPDETYVLLLQDRYGPYHVVRVDELANYLNGAAPLFEFGYTNPEGSAWVHEGARWADPQTVVYRAGLTTLNEFEYVLGGQAPE